MAAAMRWMVPSSKVGSGDCDILSTGVCAGTRVGAGLGPPCASAGAARAAASRSVTGANLAVVIKLLPPSSDMPLRRLHPGPGETRDHVHDSNESMIPTSRWQPEALVSRS